MYLLQQGTIYCAIAKSRKAERRNVFRVQLTALSVSFLFSRKLVEAILRCSAAEVPTHRDRFVFGACPVRCRSYLIGVVQKIRVIRGYFLCVFVSWWLPSPKFSFANSPRSEASKRSGDPRPNEALRFNFFIVEAQRRPRRRSRSADPSA